MTTKSGAQSSNEKLAWFFTDPASQYELAEVVRLTRCSRDDIQNWVRRGLLNPDETIPGRRIYGPATVATILVAAILRQQGVAPVFAFAHAHVITRVALDWLAGGKRKRDEMPKFDKDFRGYYAAFCNITRLTDSKPSADGVPLLPGILHVHILHRQELDQVFDLPTFSVIHLHLVWLDLAETARELKKRSSRRLSRDGA